MRALTIAMFAIILAACDSPSPEYRHAQVSRQVIGEHSFSIYFTQYKAQAIRTNFAKRPDIRAIARQAEQAIERATGCPVSEIYGDVAVLDGVLDCGKPVVAGEWATWKRPQRSGLICDGYSQISRWGDWQDITLECS
ncbi:MAG: hypothetical protein VX444_15665 [Pseudomonadota bacterium]|nr:hypothetical protein [Pseudomonadota bacterium]